MSLSSGGRSAGDFAMWSVHEGLSLVAFVREVVYVDVFLLLTLNRVQTLSLPDRQIVCIAFGGSAVLLLAVLTNRGTVELFKANDEGELTPWNSLAVGEQLVGVDWVCNVEGDFVLTWSRSTVGLMSALTGNSVLTFEPDGGVHQLMPSRRHLMVVSENKRRLTVLSQKADKAGSGGSGNWQGVRTEHLWIRRGADVRMTEDEEAVNSTLIELIGGGVRECVTRIEGSRTILAMMDDMGWLHVLGESGGEEALQTWVVELSIDIMSTLHIPKTGKNLAWSLVPHVDKRQQSFVLSNFSEHSMSIHAAGSSAAPVTSLLLDPPSYRGSHKAVDEFDSAPWSFYVASQDWLGRILEIRFDPGLSSDPRLAVDVKIASWALDSGVQRLPIPLLIPLPVMSEDRPVFVSHPCVGCLRLASRPKSLRRGSSSVASLSTSSSASSCLSAPSISVRDDLVFTLDPSKDGLLRLFHVTSPAGLDAPVSVLGDVTAAVFLAKPQSLQEVDSDPFSPFSPSTVPAASIAFAMTRSPTVTFGHVYLPATPWTRDAIRVFAEVDVMSGITADGAGGRVVQLRALEGGRRLVVVVAEWEAPCMHVISLVYKSGEWSVQRSTPLQVSTSLVDVDAVSYMGRNLVVAVGTEDGRSVAIYEERQMQSAIEFVQIGVVSRRGLEEVESVAVGEEAVAVQWKDGHVEIFEDPLGELRRVYEGEGDGGGGKMEFKEQGVLLVHRGFFVVRSRDEFRGEKWTRMSRMRGGEEAVTVENGAVYVLRRNQSDGVAVEVQEETVIEAIRSNNSMREMDKYLKLYGVIRGEQEQEEERAVDIPGVQYLRELAFLRSLEKKEKKSFEESVMVGWASVSTCHTYLLEKTLPLGGDMEWTTEGGEVALWVREGKAMEIAERLYKQGIVRYKNSKKGEELEMTSLWLSVAGKQQLLSSLYKQHGTTQSDGKSVRVGEFLGLDFTKEENKSKAMKNGIELMRQKRYILAGSVFILADLLEELVDVCCRCLEDRSLAVFLLKCVMADVRNTSRAERAKSLMEKVMKDIGGEANGWVLEIVNHWKHREFNEILDVFRRRKIGVSCHHFFGFLVKQMRILDPHLPNLEDFNQELARLRVVAARTLVSRRLGFVVEQIPELIDGLMQRSDSGSRMLLASIHKVY